MIHDSTMLYGYDYDMVIPTFKQLNNILNEGYFQRLAEWEPLTINEAEYELVVKALLSIPLKRPYRTI